MKKIINPLVEGDDDYMKEWGMRMDCPVKGCGFENVHIDRCYNVNGKDNWQAWSGRGDAAIIPMYCECGHQWLLRIGEHKGFTFIGNESHPHGDYKWEPES